MGLEDRDLRSRRMGGGGEGVEAIEGEGVTLVTNVFDVSPSFLSRFSSSHLQLKRRETELCDCE